MFSLKILILIGSLIVFIIFFKIFRKKNIFGLQGKLVYLDEGKKSKTFVNHKFKIIAKPDFIFKHWWGQFYMIEHKESYREPSRADIVQVKAALIAVRSEIPSLKKYIYQLKKVYIDITLKRVREGFSKKYQPIIN
ncbi:hypothetical protein CF386_12015 [Paraphotobacterium marinum]|uniref:Uncharacterized protein n=1 Tax=Paraphotobacterium marinum TaxID=1755811 RepID=A0A220VHH8_9GAMM|nr:hypothetical protein [Paraphotobacterium marinum]ASK79761.1 hypothetical protein CF386_12015 [Paraphotobacterium marinum]